VPSVFSSTPGQATDCANRHVPIANNLAAEADSRQSARRKHVALGNRHPIGLAMQELNTACRATRMAPASMQLVDPRILFKSQDEALILGHFVLADSVNRKRRHRVFLLRFKIPFRSILRASCEGKVQRCFQARPRR
jgi:hypothetical protein